MDDKSAEAIARETLIKLDQRKAPLSSLVVPLAVLALVVLCLGISWIAQYSERRPAGTRAEGRHSTPRLIPVPVKRGAPSLFITVQTGIAERDDLFFHTVVPTTTYRNLTQSPSITEVWPVIDTTGQYVAYYGIGESGTDVYILDLSDGTALPLTVHAGASGLHTDFEITAMVGPAFSPNGMWLAFPAQAKDYDAIELFIAQDDGQQVLRVTDLGYQVRDYIWLDDHKLVIAVQRPDGTLHYWTAQLEPQRIRLEPLS